MICLTGRLIFLYSSQPVGMKNTTLPRRKHGLPSETVGTAYRPMMAGDSLALAGSSPMECIMPFLLISWLIHGTVAGESGRKSLSCFLRNARNTGSGIFSFLLPGQCRLFIRRWDSKAGRRMLQGCIITGPMQISK